MRSSVSERFVFVDECSTNAALSPIYARAPKGERARGKAPKNGRKRLAYLRHRLYGGEDFDERRGRGGRKTFEAYLERCLVPKLKRGQIVVMDNFSMRKSKRVQRLIEDTECELLFLPPCSPGMNPIEEAFSEAKASLGRSGARRTRKALVAATGRALDARSTAEAIRGFYADCGHRPPPQLL